MTAPLPRSSGCSLESFSGVSRTKLWQLFPSNNAKLRTSTSRKPLRLEPHSGDEAGVNSDQVDLKLGTARAPRAPAEPNRRARPATHTPEKAQRSKKQLGKASKAILNKIDTKLQSDKSCMTGDE